jgi:AcrR family transcriptional regulator
VTDQKVSIEVAAPPAPGARRLLILDAAARVIVRDGADRLRMSAVAREAGVSSALIHYHFDTREELIRRAFAHHDRVAAARTAERLATIADPVERIREQLAHQLSDGADVRAGWVIWAELQRLAIHDPTIRANVVRRSRRWVESIADLLVEAQAAGHVDPQLDPAQTALRLTALVDGLGEHLLLGSASRAQAQRLLDTVLREVLGR